MSCAWKRLLPCPACAEVDEDPEADELVGKAQTRKSSNAFPEKSIRYTNATSPKSSFFK
jgi:hypothetical protein